MDGDTMNNSFEELSPDGSKITKSGRVRKKSAKVLEMEEAEKLEKKLFKKDTNKNMPAWKKQAKKLLMSVQPVSSSENKDIIDTTHISPKKTEVGIAKLGATFSKLPTKTPEAKVKVEVKSEPTLENNTENGGIKLKLLLSPIDPAENDDTSPVDNTPVKIKKEIKSPKKRKSGEGNEIIEKDVKIKKKKVKKPASETVIKQGVSTEDDTPSLLLALSEAASQQLPIQPKKAKAKKEGKKKLKSEAKAQRALLAADAINMKPNVADGEVIKADDIPVYSDTAQMALKLQTSAERKATKEKKVKKSKDDTDKPIKKEKRKRGPTAYMMWCRINRPNVVAEHPGIDFAEISKRLGELWQATPDKQKLLWRRKAKRLAAKGITNLISTGKEKQAKPGSQLTKVSQLRANQKGSTKQQLANSSNTGTDQSSSASQSKPSAIKLDIAPYKETSCQPVDVAAHLKLLGESLGIIGARLQEHQGQIAVQGSLSVLLDSLLCALGPLACLTNQVPHLNACPPQVHSKTLDDIAYIMPGIG